MFVGSFEPDDMNQFQADVVTTFKAFKAAGVKQLLIDLTGNGGKEILAESYVIDSLQPRRGPYLSWVVPASIPFRVEFWLFVRLNSVF